MVDRLPVSNPDEQWIALAKTNSFGTAKGRPTWVIISPAQEEGDVLTTYCDELPDPIPDAKIKRGGYPITLTFAPSMDVKNVKARLTQNGHDIECWLSTPEAPANKDFELYQQNTVCLISKQPLNAGARYTVFIEAIVNSDKWDRKWSFNTSGQATDRMERVPIPAAAKDIEKLAPMAVTLLNRFRRNSGLYPVTLDPELSKASTLHAEYLKRNEGKPAIEGLKAHNEDPALPGYTEVGHKAGQASVICERIRDPLESVSGWMNTLYHRIPMLAPRLKRVGFGCVKVRDNDWICVMYVRGEE
jgi:uncharacterized protein YkwD